MVGRGDIFQLINFASFSRWLFIAMATLGMLIHRYRFPHLPRPFKVGRCKCAFLWTPIKPAQSILNHIYSSNEKNNEQTDTYIASLSMLFFFFDACLCVCRRCPWPSQSSSLWCASSLWACLCTLTPGTPGEAVSSPCRECLSITWLWNGSSFHFAWGVPLVSSLPSHPPQASKILAVLSFRGGDL